MRECSSGIIRLRDASRPTIQGAPPAGTLKFLKAVSRAVWEGAPLARQRHLIRNATANLKLGAGLEDAGEGLAVFSEEYEPADGGDQAWENADGEHEDVEDQDVYQDGADER